MDRIGRSAVLGGCSALLVACSLVVPFGDLSGGGEGNPDGGDEPAADGDSPDAAAREEDAPGAAPARIYVFGGTPDPDVLPPSTPVLFADVLADGMLGSWQNGPSLPAPRMYAAAVRGPSFVALVGGLAPGGERDTLVIGSRTGRDVAGFLESSSVLSGPRRLLGAAARGDTVFALGGVALGGATLADVQYGSVGVTSVGVFAAGPALPGPLARMATAQSDTALYVVGGTDGGGVQTSTILMARFAETGGLSAFSAQVPLPTARSYAGAIVYGRALVVTGGDPGDGADFADVLVFPIGPSDELGAPRATVPLPRATSRHQVVVHGGHVYVIGGLSRGVTSDVFVGDLTTTGDVSAWRATTPLPGPLVFHSALAAF